MDSFVDAVAGGDPVAVDRLLEQAQGRSTSEIRQLLVTGLRHVLDQGHVSARALLERPRHGLICARHLSAVMDGILCCLHAAATRHFYPALNPSASERIAVVAVLAVGIVGLARGTSDPRRSQRLMRARVATQAIALILVVALLALRWYRAT